MDFIDDLRWVGGPEGRPGARTPRWLSVPAAFISRRRRQYPATPAKHVLCRGRRPVPLIFLPAARRTAQDIGTLSLCASPRKVWPAGLPFTRAQEEEHTCLSRPCAVLSRASSRTCVCHARIGIFLSFFPGKLWQFSG